MSLSDLADWLNERGLAPRSKRGYQTFGQKTVRTMLSNRFCIGDIVYKGEVVAEGLHEPAIDHELFDRVQRVLEERARRPRSYAASAPRVYMLSGIGICAGCGSPLWVNSTKHQRHAYYRCSSRGRDVGCPDRRETARGDAVEDQIAVAFESMRLPSQWRTRVTELVESAVPEPAVDRSKLEESIARAREGFLAGVLDTATAKVAIDAAQRELATMPKPVSTATVTAGEAIMDVHELWPNSSAEGGAAVA